MACEGNSIADLEDRGLLPLKVTTVMKIYSKDENLYFHYLKEKEDLQMNDNHVVCKKLFAICGV